MELKKIENKIKEIKQEILKIGSMRPGSLTERYNVCGVKKCRCKDKKNPQKHGPYIQLNFVHKNKSGTKFIRKQFLERIEKQTSEYRRFKELMNDWITHAMEYSNLEMELELAESDSKKQKI